MYQRVNLAAISERPSGDISERERMAVFLEHLLAYVVGSEDDLPQSLLRHSEFTESIGKAVQLYMSQLSRTDLAHLIWLLAFLCDADIFPFVSILSTYLARFVPHHCFFFLAALCELCLLCRAFGKEYQERRTKQAAVDCMAMFLHWCADEISKVLDSSARELLLRENIDLGLESL